MDATLSSSPSNDLFISYIRSLDILKSRTNPRDDGSRISGRHINILELVPIKKKRARAIGGRDGPIAHRGAVRGVAPIWRSPGGILAACPGARKTGPTYINACRPRHLCAPQSHDSRGLDRLPHIDLSCQD